MKNKGLLLIAGGIAIAAAIIAWLMFGGEAPKNPENIASNAVSAVVKNTTVSREQVENYLYKVTYDLLEGVVEEQAQGMSVRDEDKAFIATVYKYAFVGLMLDWIKNDMKGDSQLLVDRLELVIHGNVRAALERLRIDKA